MTVPFLSDTLTGQQGQHVVWASQATNVPTSGSATYALASASRPTNTVNDTTAPGSFTGSLAVNFATSKIGLDSTISIGGGSYRFATTGGVTAPSVTLNVNTPGTPAYSFNGFADAGLGAFGSFFGFLAGPNGGYAGLGYKAIISGNITAVGVAVFKKN